MGNYIPTTRTINKLFSGMLYILRKFEDLGYAKMDHHTIFKTLYRADRKRLCKDGSTVFGDIYIAMDFGPVPSAGSNILGQGRPKYNGKLKEDVFLMTKEADIPFISALIDPDLDHLSKMDIACLDDAVLELKEIGIGPNHFWDRTIESHGPAWGNAYHSNAVNKIIQGKDMINDGDGSPQIIESYLERHEVIKAIVGN